MPLFRTDHCRSFLAHWQSLRVGGAIPTLKDYLGKPHPILQPNVAIKDVIGPGHLNVRLFGTHLVEVAGVDPTGQNLMVFAGGPAMADELFRYQNAVATHPAGLASVKRAATAGGRTISFEDVELPLTPFPGGPPCLVCCLGFVEVLDYKDKMFKLLAHTSIHWIDVGWGVPAPAEAPAARSDAPAARSEAGKA
ncbi:MAG: PAS domain-containing protein [Rhodospirillaceae bacterium]